MIHKEYDVIIVDTDSVFDNDKADLITKADKVVMITKQTKGSVCTIQTLFKNMSCGDREKFFLVCNDFNKEKHNYLDDPEYNLKIKVCDFIKHCDKSDDEILENIDVQELSLLLSWGESVE